MSNAYSTKYKACAPEETAERILRILKAHGIETQEEWYDSGVGAICSVRVTIRGTDIGQNGKGTDRAFARAGGYAEFMERLQTGYLLPERLSSMPGSKKLTREEVKTLGGGLLEKTLRQIRRTDGGYDFLPPDADLYLDLWDFDADGDGRIAAVPFVRLRDGKEEYLPENILRAYYFTNGCCAGNTKQEALVQGLSEIAERYAMAKILRERLTPPVIPDREFAGWPVPAGAVRGIRESGRFDLRIMDASCGMGLPVAAAALTDRETGKMIIRFGAHPRFEIALERCLTEILQGKHLEKLESVAVYDFADDAGSTGFINVFNLMKSGTGSFPAECFLEEPSWEYRPFAAVPEDIGSQLRFMEDLYAALGWEIYARDCSFTGFPAFQVLSPGVSMVLDFGSRRLSEKRMLHVFRSRLKDLPVLPEDGIREIRKTMLLKRHFVIENTFPWLSGLPLYPKLLGIDVNADLLAAVCSLVLGENEEALRLLRPYRFDGKGRITKLYALSQLISGGDSETAYHMTDIVCPPGWAGEARSVLRDPRAVLAAIAGRDCPGVPVTVTDQTGLLQNAVNISCIQRDELL